MRQALEIEIEHHEAVGLAVSAKVANWIAVPGPPGQAPRTLGTLWGRCMAEAREGGFDLSGLARSLTGHRERQLSEADIVVAFDRLASAEGLTREASIFRKGR